jgi:hypothetical protein
MRIGEDSLAVLTGVSGGWLEGEGVRGSDKGGGGIVVSVR